MKGGRGSRTGTGEGVKWSKKKTKKKKSKEEGGWRKGEGCRRNERGRRKEK